MEHFEQAKKADEDMREEHTPLPLSVNDKRDLGWMDNAIYIASSQGNAAKIYNDYGNAEATARFIVTACNSHYELVAALGACLAKGAKWHPCDEVIVNARAALKKARGE